MRVAYAHFEEILTARGQPTEGLATELEEALT